MGLDSSRAALTDKNRMQLIREATLTFKLVAAAEMLVETAAPVFLLDLDAFVLRRGCFSEWLEYSESIVAQPGGSPGCPTGAVFDTLGFSINTGVMLFRPEAIHFLRHLLSRRSSRGGFLYQNHCCEAATLEL